MAEETKDTFSTAVQQQGDSAWPIPGDEGYVHPDGTEHAARQLAANRRAAADRAAAGSVIHGAPMATPGPQAQVEQAAAIARAEAQSPTSPEEARAGLTKSVAEGLEAAQAKADEATPNEATPDATKRTATTTAGKTTR